MHELADIDTGDGATVTAHVYAPKVGAAWAVVLPGVGNTARRYSGFCEYLASHGWSVVSLDYRGIGASVNAPSGGAEVDMTIWAQQDVAATIDWVSNSYQPSRLVAVGHSLGGQLVGMTPNHSRLSAVVGVAAQRGYWRHWRGWMRAFMWYLWHVHVPLCGRFLGRLPLPGGRTAVPGDAALDWARWGRGNDYATRSGQALRPRFAEVQCPMLFLSFSDDRHYAPRAAVEALVEYYCAAPRHHWHVTPEMIGLTQIGHTGFFDPVPGHSLWCEVLRWMETADERSVRACQPTASRNTNSRASAVPSAGLLGGPPIA